MGGLLIEDAQFVSREGSQRTRRDTLKIEDLLPTVTRTRSQRFWSKHAALENEWTNMRTYEDESGCCRFSNVVIEIPYLANQKIWIFFYFCRLVLLVISLHHNLILFLNWIL